MGAPELEGTAGLEAVLFMGGEELAACSGLVKWMVRVAGPLLSSERVTVMGTAGLWYLRRGRWRRQNCLRRKGVSCWGG